MQPNAGLKTLATEAAKLISSPIFLKPFCFISNWTVSPLLVVLCLAKVCLHHCRIHCIKPPAWRDLSGISSISSRGKSASLSPALPQHPGGRAHSEGIHFPFDVVLPFDGNQQTAPDSPLHAFPGFAPAETVAQPEEQ